MPPSPRSPLQATAERALKPLDRARWYTLRGLGPIARPFIVSRDLRVGVGGALMILTSLALTVVAPMWLLALGPITLGVAHVLSDVRYLVVKPGHHKRRALWIAAGVPLLAVCAGGGVLAGLIGCAAVVLVARGPLRRKLAAWAVLGALLWGAARLGWVADLIFAHAHNAIAILLWWLWRDRDSAWHWLPLLAFLGGSALLAGGTFEALMISSGALFWSPEGLDLSYHLRSLARGVSAAPWDLRLVVLFAFAQAVHYTIWLRLVPDEDRPQPTPRTFTSSYRALRDEFGDVALILVTLFALAIGVWAVFDLFSARNGYLRMAIFHGHLELAALSLWWVEERGETS